MVKEFKDYCMEDSVYKLKSIANKKYDSVSSLIRDILNDQK